MSPSDETDSPEILERIASEVDLVETIAARLHRKLGEFVEKEDLVAFASQGLLDAARRYDGTRGVSFRKYASYRVRGATYDGIRRHSALPWSICRRLERLESVAGGEALTTCRDPTQHDRWFTQEGAQRVLDNHVAGMVSAAELGLVVAADADGNPSEADSASSLDPEAQYAKAELFHRLRCQLESLDTCEREIVRRHYFDGERLQDIGASLEISKSWASRLHSRALLRLRKRLRRLVMPGS